MGGEGRRNCGDEKGSRMAMERGWIYIVGALWCAMFGDERVVPRAEIVSLNY